MTTPVSAGRGCIVLAAHRPDPELFRIQLGSIRDQTRGDWTCLVGADGGEQDVRALVADAVAEDDRFRVVGWDDNVGFYLNFERLLAAVPGDASWVALSDQDDRWDPDKLERLVPLLDVVAVATGQARVVTWPDRRVVLDSTDRTVVSPVDLLVQNQVTGAQTVFRRSLLDVALPFPRLRTVTQLHDHWLGLCAAATDGYVVLDEVVQDYVQHGSNVVGEVADRHPRNPWGAVKLASSLADEYEGGHRPRQVLGAAHTAGVGWRRLVAQELARRLPASEVALDLWRRFGRPGPLRTARSAVAALRSPDVTTGTALTLVAGLPGELVARRPPGRAAPREAGPVESSDGPVATCWLCGAAARPDARVGALGFSRCTRCGFLFQAARSSAEDEARRYDASYFDDYAARTGGHGHYDEHADQRRSEAGERVAFVRRHTGSGGDLMEIGAASGYFVEAAAAAGFDSSGVEPSSATAAEARARGLDVVAGTLADIARRGDTHDVVAAWHVLEHLPQPRDAAAQLFSVVRPGGWLFLELPNADSVAAARGGASWPHLDPDAHVAHYGPHLVRSLLEGAGFVVPTVETFSVRAFTTRRLRRSLHAVHDGIVLRTPRLTDPSRHELLRVAARRPADP